MEIKGVVKKINEIQSGVSKAGKEWKKQTFVIDTGDQYNPDVCFSVFGEDKLEMVSKLKLNEKVTVHFNLSSREFNGSWYHNIDAWRIEKGEKTETMDQQNAVKEEIEKLPF